MKEYIRAFVIAALGLDDLYITVRDQQKLIEDIIKYLENQKNAKALEWLAQYTPLSTGPLN